MEMADKKQNRLVHGFLIGLGFSVALVLVVFGGWYLYVEYIYKQQVASMMESTGWKEYSRDAGLEISEHRPVRTDNNLEVVGTLKNTGADAWESVSVEVELFDADNRFVDECSEYVNSVVFAGGTEHFKVSCGGCEKRPLVEYDHYEIKVTDASYVQP